MNRIDLSDNRARRALQKREENRSRNTGYASDVGAAGYPSKHGAGAKEEILVIKRTGPILLTTPRERSHRLPQAGTVVPPAVYNGHHNCLPFSLCSPCGTVFPVPLPPNRNRCHAGAVGRLFVLAERAYLCQIFRTKSP